MSVEIWWGSGSGPAWRVLLGAAVKGVPLESHLLSFSAGDTRSDWFRAINPRGKVPTIRDGDFVLNESLAILAWLEAKKPQPGLARKLPHYGRYAWLRFQGAAPSNIGKGDWPVTHSPLRQTFRAGAQLKLPARKPLLPMPTTNSSSPAP